jgi:hypothetical protein
MSVWIEGPPPGAEEGTCPPGVLLEFEDGEQVLVGHVNQMNGLCNDCTRDEEFRHALRHKVVWTP